MGAVSVATSATRPASVARVTVVRGGRAGVAKFIEHPATRGRDALETVSEVAPERISALATVLERSQRIEFGNGAPAVGHEAEWLTEKLGRGEQRVGALGAVLTVGKGVSMLAATDPEVASAVQDALRAGSHAYYEYVAQNAMTRIGPRDHQQHVPIDPASLRAVGWLHGHSAAGDPHSHAHILIASTAHIQGNDTARAIDSKHFIEQVAQQAEAAARVAMIETLCKRGLDIDPLSLDLAGIDEQALKHLDRFSTMRAVVHEGEAHGLSHEAAWRAARRAMSTNDGQPLANDLRPLVEQVRAWASQTWTIPTPDGDIELRLSRVEALEHALDALSRTPEGRKVVLAWQQERSGGAFLEAVSELERIRTQAQRHELTPAELVADYTRRLGQAAEAGQVLTRQALASHAQAISAAHPGLDVDQVNEVLQANFVEIPRRRGLVAVAELEANITLAELAMYHLAKAKTVQDALTHHTGITITQGVAGAGKTTAAMQAAREHWAYEHNQIWVLSRNAKTAHDLGAAVRVALEEVGADPSRVHAVPLADPSWRRGLEDGDRIVVDEYALSERRDFNDLITLSTVCPVSLLGDTHQQRAIETPTAAQVLGHVAEQAGQPNLTDTVRCQTWRELHDDLRAAPGDEDARERAVAGLDIRMVGSPAEAARIAREEGATLLARSNELAAEAAASIQSTTGPRITVRHGVEVGTGEQVVFRAIVRDEWRHILGRTGDVATVAEISDAHVMLRHEDGRQAWMSLEDAREHLAPASAQTIDAAQGRTVQQAAVLLTGAEDAHALYSAATRGREAPIILVLQQDEQDENSRAVGVDQQDIDPRKVVSEVLSRSDRGTFLGLEDEDRRALIDELRERDHNRVAERLEQLEADIARITKHQRDQEREPVREQADEQAYEQSQEFERTEEWELDQEPEWEYEPEWEPEQAYQQPEEWEYEPEWEPEPVQEPEWEPEQESEWELDPDEQIRREIEQQFRELNQKLRQKRERGLGWEIEL